MFGYNFCTGIFEFRHQVRLGEKIDSILVRPYSSSDLSEVCRIFTLSNPGKTPEEIMGWTLPTALENNFHYQFVAAYGGMILGAVSGRVRDKRKEVNGYIDDIAVDKDKMTSLCPQLRQAVDYLGKRVSLGSLLLDDVIHAFLNDRLPGVELDVYEENVNARRFYDEHGFYVKNQRVISPEEGLEGFMVGATAYTMRRDLDSSSEASNRWRKYNGIK